MYKRARASNVVFIEEFSQKNQFIRIHVREIVCTRVLSANYGIMIICSIALVFILSYTYSIYILKCIIQ